MLAVLVPACHTMLVRQVSLACWQFSLGAGVECKVVLCAGSREKIEPFVFGVVVRVIGTSMVCVGQLELSGSVEGSWN